MKPAQAQALDEIRFFVARTRECFRAALTHFIDLF